MEADGGASAARDFGENCLDLAGDYCGDGGEAEAVFVAEGEVAQQIADGDDAASFESGGALRAYAVEVLDRVGEGDGHRDVCACLAPAVASLLYHRSRVAREGAAFTTQSKEGKTLNSRSELGRIRSWGPKSDFVRDGEPSEVASLVQSVEMLRFELAEARRQCAFAVCKPLPCNVLDGECI